MCTKTRFWLCLALFSTVSCSKEKPTTLLDDLQKNKISNEFIIACAAGMQDGFMNNPDNAVSFFFYPVEGATDFKYYETKGVDLDQNDYTQYHEKEVIDKDVFNGYLKQLPLGNNKNNRWGIITYMVNDSLRICDPVHIKIQNQPTQWNPDNITIENTTLSPTFNWINGAHDVIHFQVVSNLQNDLISGTYTVAPTFTFYDLSNVVLNITTAQNPALEQNTNYNFTLMSVSEDNWVNSFAQKSFITPE